LCITDSFELPISDLLPASHWKHPAWVEIRVLNEENPRPELFSINALGKFDLLHEEDRREKTPLLLAANPNEFIILISHRNPGGCCLVVDGHHRLAIAQIAGLERIKVKAVFNIGLEMGDLTLPSKVNWRWFLLPFPRSAAK